MSEPVQALQLLLDGAKFDLVLCDLMMPQLSGMDLFHRAVAARPGVEKRFIFMTGGVFGPEAEKFLEKVPNPRLAKPFPVEQLEAMIQRLLGSI
jgi:CheY-like chemotaxis protein